MCTNVSEKLAASNFRVKDYSYGCQHFGGQNFIKADYDFIQATTTLHILLDYG